jgi:F1F0 ATPase subunit 2
MIEFFIGIILGIVFFGGLYFTVRKLTEINNPSVLFVFSFIVRMAVLLWGLFYVSKGGYKGVLFTLLGILVIRYIMIFIINNPRQKTAEKD